MNGIISGKGFSAFQVNDALLAKVVEAITKGESDARRYSQVRSFEIYYDGFRTRMLFGRIMVIPAKLADSFEDFPSTLLYGAMVREMTPEAQADLYMFKLGESEFDEYDEKGMKEIKEKLFKDAEGKFRSIVLFMPTWANVRDYVIFKFTPDEETLTRLVRHQIYGVYYDPALSSAFDLLQNETDNLNVNDVTPKEDFPGLAGGEKAFPDLQPGDGSKVASAFKPRMIFAKDTVDALKKELLDPAETAVLDELSEKLKAHVSGEISDDDDVVKQAALTGLVEPQAPPKIKPAPLPKAAPPAPEPVVNPGQPAPPLKPPDPAKRTPEAKPPIPAPKERPGKRGAAAKDDDEEAETSLRNRPDYNSEINCLSPRKDASTVVLSREGATLVRVGDTLEAHAKLGHVETIRVNASKIKWVRPNQFTLAFRAAAEQYVRNPRHDKQAAVPLTFDSIWSEIATDFGPAPVAKTPVPTRGKGAPTDDAAPAAPSSDEKPAADAKAAPEDGKAKPFEKKQEPKAEAKPEAKAEGKANPFEKGKPKEEKPAAEEKKDEKPDFLKKKDSKLAAFDMFIPGQVLKEFYPEVLNETVEYPSDSFSQQTSSPDGLPPAGEPYISTDPAAAMGIGRDGKKQIMEGAPLRQENDIRGYSFDQEYYSQREGIPGKAFAALHVLASINKTASATEFKAQFGDFLKKAMGEVAATFIAAFKTTYRPPMKQVPGTGEIKLDDMEQAATFPSGGLLQVASRVRYLMSKLTDSDIQECINGAWSQAAVFNSDAKDGYTYEIFVRPETIDKQTLVLKYSWVAGTKGL